MQKICQNTIFGSSRISFHSFDSIFKVVIHYLKNKVGVVDFANAQKLCFDKFIAWKEYNFPSGFLINAILNFAQEWDLLVSEHSV